MSILIKSIDMPKNCGECKFAVDGWCYAKEPTEPNSKSLATHTRPTWCPITELPLHGDLIDRDALNNAFTGMRFNADSLLLHYGDREDWYLKGSEVETLITNATTIIESEE